MKTIRLLPVVLAAALLASSCDKKEYITHNTQLLQRKDGKTYDLVVLWQNNKSNRANDTLHQVTEVGWTDSRVVALGHQQKKSGWMLVHDYRVLRSFGLFENIEEVSEFELKKYNDSLSLKTMPADSAWMKLRRS